MVLSESASKILNIEKENLNLKYIEEEKQEENTQKINELNLINENYLSKTVDPNIQYQEEIIYIDKYPSQFRQEENLMGGVKDIGSDEKKAFENIDENWEGEQTLEESETGKIDVYKNSEENKNMRISKMNENEAELLYKERYL